MRLWVRSLALLSELGFGIAVSYGAGQRCSLDPALLWLRAVAAAPIGPLAWEPPYAAGAALEKAKRQKKGGGGVSVTQKERQVFRGSLFVPPAS